MSLLLLFCSQSYPRSNFVSHLGSQNGQIHPYNFDSSKLGDRISYKPVQDGPVLLKNDYDVDCQSQIPLYFPHRISLDIGLLGAKLMY